MVDIVCSCCNGCSSRRQLSIYPNYGFPKKLLVAISVVVILAMCVIPTEARSLDVKKRHKRPENMAQTKETLRTGLEHKRRHQRRLENLTMPTKDTMTRHQKKTRAEMYNREMKKIVKKLRNTGAHFSGDKEQLNELREYRQATPSWLPSVNFVEIHHHDYKSNRTRKNGTTIPERKFTYIMPKLYKSLVEYETLFKRLQLVELDFPDDPYNSYKTKRKLIIQNALDKLASTIQEITDSMEAVKLTTTPPNKNKLDLSTLESKVDATQCLINDYLAFRGYGNLLNNWYLEIKCSTRKGRQARMKTACRKYEAKLQERSNSRSKGHKNRNA